MVQGRYAQKRHLREQYPPHFEWILDVISVSSMDSVLKIAGKIYRFLLVEQRGNRLPDDRVDLKRLSEERTRLICDLDLVKERYLAVLEQ